MSLSYAREKTMGAVLGMAGSPKSINDRIADAFAYHLMHINPAEDVPVDLRSKLAEIRTALTSTEAQGDEGSVKASARAMSEDQAVEVARKILDFHDQIATAEE